MEDMKITIEKKTIGKDEKIDWYVEGSLMDKILVDKETAIALHWQLMKERMMGEDAFRESMEMSRAIPERVWTYAEVVDAAAELKEAIPPEFEISKKLY